MNRSGHQGMLLFCAMCLLGGSCCRKEPKPVTWLIPEEMKAYWNFNVGTWWVFQDSATGAIDTVTVTAYKNFEFEGTLSHSGESARCEYLEILTLNGNDGFYNRYWINTSHSSESPLSHIVKRTKFGPSGSEGGNSCFVYPIVFDNKTYNPLGLVTDTCIVKGFWQQLWGYADVGMMYQNRNTLDGNQHTRTYFAKDVGIVKQVFVDSNVVKTLVDYHIVQ